MATNQASMTAEELLSLGDIGRCELIRGELVRMSPAGFEHGVIAMRIGRMIAEYVERHGLGVSLAAETGFKIAHSPDTVRAPDAAFISKDRLPTPLPRRGFFPGAPDLAVEVVSPDDACSEVTAKVSDWLQAGCRLVWIIDPPNRTITVHERLRSSVRTLGENDTLDGGNVLPGFRLPVRDVFAGP